MALSTKTASAIRDLLVKTVRAKLDSYEPETVHMPFHHRLLGADRYAVFSFIHSMNTTFGMSIWEQVASLLAEAAGWHAERQYRLLGSIDKTTEAEIRQTMLGLRSATQRPSRATEIARIRRLVQPGPAERDPDSVVDLFIETESGEYYFDITSAKPNMKEFAALKEKLLRWAALRLSQDKKARVFPTVAIPYNPYHPQPYDRFTLAGLFDLNGGEVLVGPEFWDEVAGSRVYDSLLDVFQVAGKELRKAIDARFASFARLT